MHYLQLYFGNDEIDSFVTQFETEVRGKNLSKKSRKKWGGRAIFSHAARDSLVLRT